MKRSSLKHKYGITLEEYYEMWEAQDNKCAICQKPLTDGKMGAHVDHDHACCEGKRSCGECIRGILCGACSIGIAKFNDSASLMYEASNYVNWWRAKHVAEKDQINVS